MAVINSIENGIVIDHITAGLGIKMFDYLDIKKSSYHVAFIMNAPSTKHGRKDIIKIENANNIDLAILGLIDPHATVSIIENHVVSKKLQINLPKTINNIVCCKNPRCVTSVEKNIPHIFHLVDEEKGEYACEYCDDIISLKNGKGLKK